MIDTVIFGAMGLNAFAVALVLLRAWIYKTRLYRPFLKNIGLSIAPVVVLLLAWLALILQVQGHLLIPPLGVVIAAALLVVWLMLLPNAGYLITELNLSHRDDQDAVPIWFDIVLVISLAMSGVVNTVGNVLAFHTGYSVSVHDATAGSLLKVDSIAVVIGILLLVSFGMYLGRSKLRLNSWDVLRPWRIIRAIIGHLRTPGTARDAAGFVLLHAIFIGLMYFIIAGTVIGGIYGLETVV